MHAAARRADGNTWAQIEYTMEPQIQKFLGPFKAGAGQPEVDCKRQLTAEMLAAAKAHTQRLYDEEAP